MEEEGDREGGGKGTSRGTGYWRCLLFRRYKCL